MLSINIILRLLLGERVVVVERVRVAGGHTLFRLPIYDNDDSVPVISS